MRAEIIKLWPDENTVQSIDAILRDNWLLDLQPDIELIGARHPEMQEVICRYDEAHERAVQKAGRSGKIDEREMFRLLAHPGLFAFAAAARRHYILDGVALAIGVLKHFALGGPVLDVGCHIGVSTNIFGRLTANKIVGLDPVGAAIDSARKLSADLPNVEFVRGMLPWRSATQFDLVFCQDVLHHVGQSNHPGIIASLGDLVKEGGVLILSADDVIDQDWLKRNNPVLQKAQLGYFDSDVLGGFGGNPAKFQAATAVLLRKGDTTAIPMDVASISAREWETHFKDFANTPGRSAREKTQAFERATRRTSEH
ncbi:class I SAM-dependent methyltransferase [Bradyrhizobium sp. RDI18]|uniref:class I SAM-dependent methyltransferase n=1 Tax=Bradyrhizobium sp. RDI18 TaxID=3367400 RepID=UPI00372348D1